MREKLSRISITFLFLIAFACESAAQKPISFSELVFKDEFEGAAGAAIDANKWTMEIGGGGWGNEELEYYTNTNENSYLDGKGSLVIKAERLNSPLNLKCWYGPCEYTSARLITKGKFARKYGRFEARIKLPRGKGIWPAFWLLGNNIDKVGWPRCGEIDVMENIGREPTMVHGTIHGPGYSGAKGIGAAYSLPDSSIFAEDFHVYAVEWSKGIIRFYVDGSQYKSITPKDLPPGAPWVYDHPFFILLNVAVGGTWPGKPDETTVFPQMMLVDYVRVYKR
jgi:beta-glucanase (GH16 family)